MYKLINFS